MKKIYANNQNTVLLQHNKTIRLQDNKTKDIRHISGVDNTTSQMTSSKSDLASTRGAKVSNEFIEKKYRESAAKIRDEEIFFISVSIKGKKTQGARREVNIDFIFDSADKPFFYKSHTVCKKLKWELFRDLPDAEKTATCWQAVQGAFEQQDSGVHAGKLITRRPFTTIPKFRVSNCAIITEEHATHVMVYLMLGEKMYEVRCDPCTGAKASKFFNWKGNYKGVEEMEVL